MACLPLTVTRVYDSRDKGKGDFGIGWRLDVQTLRLRESRTMGTDWAIDLVNKPGPFNVPIPTYTLYDLSFHKVSLTLPDGHVEEFDLTLQPTQSQFNPIGPVSLIYTPRPGTLGSLAPEVTATYAPSADTGAVELINSDAEILDPRVYRYTAQDGTVYLIDKFDGVKQVQCTTGPTLTIGPNGITHSTGKGISFSRDSQGRIIQITDPNGNVQEYSYDANGDLIGHTDAEANQTTFKYNYRHGLLEIDDPRGVRAIRNEYDDAGRLISSTDAVGKTAEFSHDLVARTETVTDRLGHITVYAYDDKGNVIKQTDALGHETTFIYDAFGNQTSKTDPLGRTTTSEYDSRRNLLSETDPLGQKTQYAYTSLSAVRKITDPLGRITTNSYDIWGNLTVTTDPLGHITAHAYDTGGVIFPGTMYLTGTTDALGQVTHYNYNSVGNIIKETNPLGQVTEYTYDANGNRLSETKTRTLPGGATETLVTGFEYDRNNRLTKTTHPDGSTTQTIYNEIGKQAETVDPLGRVTKYDYDAQGRLVQTTYPDGKTETSTYDAEGRRLASTDRAGRETNYVYDALGRLTETRYSDGARTTTTYDAAGQVIASTDALGQVTHYEYDAAGRRAKVIDAIGHVTTFTYDAAGNQTQVTDASNHVTTFGYDDGNRRTQVVYPDSTKGLIAYDALGRTIKKIDQAGKETRFTYDALGRLIQVTDALDQETTYGYDEQGNQISQTDANGHVTTFAYDRQDRRIARQLPLGQTESMGYDAAGNLLSKTDFNGKVTTYTYDSLNRLVSKTPDPDLSEPTVSYSYTASGQRAAMTDATGTTNYTYNNRDRLTEKATPQGTLKYTYTANGSLAGLQSNHANGIDLAYDYDSLNRLAKVADRQINGETTYSYDTVGNLAGYVYPNGVETAYTYNALNRLAEMQVKKGTTDLARYSYTLGPTGNRTQVQELGGRTVQYAYDDLYRLVKETISGAVQPNQNGEIGYGYDLVGNRLQRTSTVAGIANQSFTYDANDRLNTESYDANSSTIGSDGKTYGYDFENHLTEMNSGEVGIVYDGDGNRVAKIVGGVTTQYLVDDRNPTGYAQVLEEIENGAVVRSYTYGLDLISQKQASGVSFYGYDGHGSVRLLTDASGTVTDTYTYDAFGGLIGSSGTTPNVYLYAGEQVDGNVGFYYLRARNYDHSIGRFRTLDPASWVIYNPTTLHRYIYAGNNPTTNLDPSGEYYFSLVDVALATQIRNTLAQIQADAEFRVLNWAKAKVEKAEFRLITGLDLISLLPLAGQLIKLPPGIPKIAEKVPSPIRTGEWSMAIDQWIGAFRESNSIRWVPQQEVRVVRLYGGTSPAIGHWLITEETYGLMKAFAVDPKQALNIPLQSGNTLKDVQFFRIKPGAVVYSGGIEGGAEWAVQHWVRDLSDLIPD